MGSSKSNFKKNQNIVRNTNDIFCATQKHLNDLKSDFLTFNQILASFNNGISTVELKKKYMQRMIDEAWVNIIEDTLPSIDAIIRNPKGGLDDFEEIRPIELTRKVTSKSVVHLSQHTDYINEIKDDGTVLPARLLNAYNDETMLTYENKFINTLIYRLFSFVMLRYDKCKEYAEDAMMTSYEYTQTFDLGETRNKINISIDVTEPPKNVDEIRNYLYTSDLWTRIEKICEWCKSLISSKFCKEMGKNYVRPPITRTNKLLQNVDFRQCLSCWEFLESYESTGYETKVHESLEEVSEDFLKDFYNSVAAQYILFRNSIGSEFNQDKTLDERDVERIDPRVKDELGKVDEKDYEEINDLYDPLDTFLNETEEEIDFALRVALEADKLTFTEDDFDVDRRNIIYKYIYSYLGRIIKAGNPTQDFYTEIKNKALGYKKVKSIVSWKHEVFKYKSTKLMMIESKGKHLIVHLPLDPKDYDSNKYKFIDVSEKKSSDDYPLALKVNNVKTQNQVIELFDDVVKKYELKEILDRVLMDYHYPAYTPDEMCDMVPPLAKRIAEVQTKFVEIEREVEGIEATDEDKYKYVYSYKGRMIMAQDPCQAFYTEIKNELLSHENVNSKISWKHELFTCGRIRICKLKVKGKTLCVYLPLDPKDYANTGLKFFDESDSKIDELYPMMIKVKSSRQNRFVLELLNEILDKENILPLKNPKVVDYHMEYKTPEELCEMDPPLAYRVNKLETLPKLEPEQERIKLKRIVGKNNVELIKTVYKDIPKAEKEKEIVIEYRDRIIEPENVLQRYNLSHMAKYIRAQYPLQDYYTQIRNAIDRYEISSRMSWKHELFWNGRNTICEMMVKGKTLNVYLPLNPDDYKESKYVFKDVRDEKSHEDTPFLMKITSSRKCDHVIELLESIIKSLGIKENKLYKFKDHHKKYKTIDELVSLGLAKEIEYKEFHIEKKPKEEVSDAVLEEMEKNEALFISRYNVSHEAKFIRSDDTLKNYYTLLRNELDKFEVNSRVSWKHELFWSGKNTVCKFMVKGKSLYVYLPLNPSDYKDSKYKYKDVSDKKAHADTPFLMKITSDRKASHVIELIKEIASKLGLKENAEYKFTDYSVPKKSIKKLLELGLIKERNVKVNIEPKEEKNEEMIIAEAEKNDALFISRYNVSHEAKFMRASEPLQTWYTQIRNHLERYEVNSRVSWKHELFWSGSNTIVKFMVKGKSLYVYMPFDPDEFKDSKYKYKDVRDKKSHIDTPFLMKVTSDRKVKHVIELLDILIFKFNLQENKEFSETDYHKKNLPIKKLLELGLIKERKITEIPVVEAPKAKVEETHEVKEVVEENDELFYSRYDFSHEAKFMRAGNPLQNYYNRIRNHLERFDVNSRMSWKHELFWSGSDTIVKFMVKGKSLYAYLPLNPDDYIISKYRYKDVRDVSAHAYTPMLIKITSDRKVNHVIELIDTVLASHEVKENKDFKETNYHKKNLPIKKLLELGLIKERKIKEVKHEVVSDDTLVDTRYNYSHEAKIMRAQNPLQNYYTIIKNYINKFDVNSRMSWKHELFWSGTSTIVKLAIKGKTLYAYLPLNPDDYIISKYRYKDVRDVSAHAYTPMLMTITSDRKVNHVLELIASIISELGVKESKDFKEKDYHKKNLPIKKLLEMGLVKERIVKAGEVEEVKEDIPVETSENIMKYSSSSIVSKFIQASKEIESYYQDVKNYISSFNNVFASQTWTHDEYFIDDLIVFETDIKGGALVLTINEPYVNFNPKYGVKAVLDYRGQESNKSYLEVKSDRSLKYAYEIIEKKMKELGLMMTTLQKVDYKKEYGASLDLEIVKNYFSKIK